MSTSTKIAGCVHLFHFVLLGIALVILNFYIDEKNKDLSFI